MKKIKICIVGVGNCVSSLLQGIEFYKNHEKDSMLGLMHWDIGGYKPYDIEVALAYDIDIRKVGMDVNKAIFQKPNCTYVFFENMPKTNVMVEMGCVLDGVAKHMESYSEDLSFRISSYKQPPKNEVVKRMKETGVEVLLNYLPVGSEEATKFYMECALDAGVAVVNNIPVFIASDKTWAQRFHEKNLPIIGDDIKAQLGATITHRTLVELFKKRGVNIEKSYQLNVAGNTDFLNMLDRSRLYSKKISKTDAVQSIGNLDNPDFNLHIGPSDFIPWQKDQKICYLRLEGSLFGNVPMYLDLKLSVEDSPNSAGVVIDAIRCCKLALDQKIGGVLLEPSSYFCKHPMEQYTDSDAFNKVNDFIDKYSKDYVINSNKEVM